ncbi:hypothetical protein KAJ27_05965 [bacterium]|nr:hypothetical protein [bacterium]
MISPARVLLITFIAGILLGTVFLALPQASTTGKSIGILNALFTSTSAICVTGLIVIDTAKDFTLFGKFLIMLLIQIGGLGIMTFSTAFFLLIKKNLSLKEKLYLKEDTNKLEIGNIRDFLKTLIAMTLVIELLGAMIMFPIFYKDFKLLTAIKHSVFHSISAFCNAGFSTFSDSLCRYSNSVVINFTIMALIILGGIGFIVISEVINYRKNKRISLHTKLVLKMTLFLIVIGTVLFFCFEYLNKPVQLSSVEKILNSLFQSVTTRTAGFNTIDFSNLSNAAIFVMIILMFIGASPGSTGGGIKTTTITLIIYSIFNAFKGHDSVNIDRKHISSELVMKSYMLTSIYIITSIFFIFCLLYTDHLLGFREIIFEVISAIGTVGLSLGITAKLSDIGKVIIILAMFVGRVGPLTLVSGIKFSDAKKTTLKYPEVKISIG